MEHNDHIPGYTVARTEQRLRELMSDLNDDVRRGDRTSEDANAIYERAATRWMQEV